MIVGIDPGLTGAVAFVGPPGGSFDDLAFTEDTPSFVLTGNRRDYNVPGMLKIFEGRTIEHVFIERQGARPEQGVASVFKIGLGMGLWLGIVAALGFPYTVVSPQVWQREMYQGAVGEGKERSLLIASRLYPQCDIPKSRHDRADALLIATYGLRTLNGRAEKWEEIT